MPAAYWLANVPAVCWPARMPALPADKLASKYASRLLAGKFTAAYWLANLLDAY